MTTQGLISNPFLKVTILHKINTEVQSCPLLKLKRYVQNIYTVPSVYLMSNINLQNKAMLKCRLCLRL